MYTMYNRYTMYHGYTMYNRYTVYNGYTMYNRYTVLLLGGFRTEVRYLSNTNVQTRRTRRTLTYLYDAWMNVGSGYLALRAEILDLRR